MTNPNDFVSRIFGISVQEKINFARHLSLVVKAGLSVVEGLNIIKAQTESALLRRIIDSLIDDVESGKFLADGLRRYEDVFGAFFVNIVQVGEASGTLSKNLLYLADELKKSKSLQSKVRSAMIYPLIILLLTIGMSAFLAFYVFPKLIPMFTGLGVKLPLTTQILLQTTNFIKSYGLYLFVGLVFFVIFLNVLIRKVKPVKYVFDRSLLYIPVLSSLIISVNVVNFTRVFAILLKGGVKIVDALGITANTFSNLAYKETLIQSAEEIRRGGQLSTRLSSDKRLFPPLVSGMVRVGESTGNLEENLEYLSEYYSEEVDNRLRTLTSLVEPLMLLIMGLLVGFVALSIITPIYSISQGIK